ncbi:hypothetical protein CJ177_35695 [Rhodococcus sp. ACPA1]|nr:hypothetical protein CJ177_35695 [Rhodococcus sp. ACPA1]
MTSRHTDRPLVALISATPAAIAPAVEGLTEDFPEAVVWNILDDRLLTEADEHGGVVGPLAQRMFRLIDHAVTEGADAVLLTCSMYGPIARTYPAPVPVLAPDDAAFAAAVDGGFDRILVVASFEAALLDTEKRFADFVAAQSKTIKILGAYAPAAHEATRDGDQHSLLTALTETCVTFTDRIDAILLAQYSLAPVASALSERLGIPVVSGPVTAANLLRTRLDYTSETA